MQAEFGFFWPIAAVLVLCVASLFRPALKSLFGAGRARSALASKDITKARIETADAREYAQITLGWGVFALILLAFVCFVLMNNVAVGDTFFRLPLIRDKWWLITWRFLTQNLFIFVVAEILVLVWGLIVALARLAPGRAGRPIRALAIAYCDLFRGLPAIVTLYLIGFGIPTSGISEIILTPIVGMFVDLSAMDVHERAAAVRIDVIWWCVIALTLTYGAYVAEVYRAGIESIHHSQFMASRSLGLSYMQTMRHVVVPQAVRRIVAPLLNDFIGLQKDTALVQVLGVTDAFNQSKIIASNAFNLSAVTVVAFLFVIITIPQARLVDKLVERDNARMKAGG
ncbi:amino acid ABC transporter permease [Aestuariivirga litoralis]|nr:amino acid ABC transporter permease [Aestuariivirga litoralis]MBG1232003.1 amino acid ABC transporter permease [Aestuariivirga litoralis]